MFKLWAMTKNEIRMQLRRPFFWVLLAIFALLLGIVFFNLIIDFHNRVQKLASLANGITLEGEVIQKFYGNLNFLMLFLVPVMSMNSFIAEKKNWTLELVLGTNIGRWQIVLSKYLGQVFNILIVMTIALGGPALILAYGHDDYMSLLRGHLAVFLNASCYLWVTLFFSLVMDSPILVSMSSLVTVFILWLFSWFSHNSSNFLISQILEFVGLTGHFQNIVMGTVYASDIGYYFSFSAIGFLLIWHSLKARELA